jgi:TonB family protein
LPRPHRARLSLEGVAVGDTFGEPKSVPRVTWLSNGHRVARPLGRIAGRLLAFHRVRERRKAEVTTIAVAATDARAPIVHDAAVHEPSIDGASSRFACGLADSGAITFDRWRGAVERYAPVVTPSNQVELGPTMSPFASYVGAMDGRIHPFFAARFLAAFVPEPRPPVVVRLEIVLGGDGAIRRMGVVRSSGLTAFDIDALEAVACAAPFAEPSPMLRSPDGNVYLHWEFHSDPVFSCSTMNARPFLLRAP